MCSAWFDSGVPEPTQSTHSHTTTLSVCHAGKADKQGNQTQSTLQFCFTVAIHANFNPCLAGAIPGIEISATSGTGWPIA